MKRAESSDTQALEAQSLGEQELRALPANPLEHETGDDQRLQKDQEPHREPSGANPAEDLAVSRGGGSGFRLLGRIRRAGPRPAQVSAPRPPGQSADEARAKARAARVR